MSQPFPNFTSPMTDVNGIQHREETLLTVFITSIETICGFFLIWYFIGPTKNWFDILVVSGTGLMSLALHILLRRGYTRLVSWGLPVGLWAMITISLIGYGSMRDVSISAYLFVLILAALVLGEGGVIIFGALILVATAGIFFAEVSQVIQPLRNNIQAYDILVFSFILAISVFLLRVAVREINRGFSHARDRERELDALNAKLEQLVQKRTLEWENANRELTQIKDRLQYLISSNPAIIYSARIGGHIGTTYVSDNVEKQLGYAPEEFIANPEFWLDQLHPEDKPRIMRHFPKLFEHGHRTLEYRFRHRDGHYLWIQDEARLTFGPDGHSDELVGSWTDITARKQAEIALQEKDQLLQGILDNTSTLVIAKDYRNLNGQYILVNKSYAEWLETTPEALIGKNIFDVYPKEIARLLDEDDRQVFETGQVHQEEEYFPLHGQTHTLLANKFPLRDLNGDIFGMCILATNITQLKQIENNLRLSEERYRLLAQNLPRSIVMLYDQDLRFILTDGPELERGGFSRDMLEGKLLHEALPLEFANFVEPYMRRALNGDRYTAILPYEDQFYEYFYAPLPDHLGTVSIAMILGMNVTERVRSEAELQLKRENDLRFSQNLTTLQQITNQLSKAETFDELSRKAIELGRAWLDFDRTGIWFASEQHDVILGSFGTDENGEIRDERGARVQLDPSMEGWHIINQKEPIAELTGTPLFNHHHQRVGEGQTAMAPLWNGDEVIGLISIDNLLSQAPITPQHLEILKLFAISLGHLFRRKRIEEALRQSEANLQEAQKIARLGNFELDLTTQVIQVSDEIYHIFGVELGTPITLNFFQTFLAPEHFSIVTDAIARTLATGEASSMEYEIRTGSGETKHIYSVGRLLFDEKGQASGIFGIIQDITDRKRVELALRDSETLYRALFEQSNDGVALHDVATRTTVAANQALADLLECQISDIVGTSVETEILEDDLSDYRTRWQQTLDEGHLPPYERRLITHRGNIRNFEITTTVIYEPESKNPRFIQAVLRDITDRKRAEAQLQVSLHEKEILLKEIHHRVKNNLQVISSLLYLQAQKIKDENLLELFRESQNRVAAMALVHEQLYQSNNFAQVNFGTYLRTLLSTLFESYGVENQQIRLVLEHDESTLDVHMAIPCGLLVSEIVSNALKYAFPRQNTGQITVQFSQIENLCHLQVRDNGIGMPSPDQIRPGSLGLQLIDRLVAQIGGTIARTIGPGTIYSIQFPRV